MGVRRPYQVSCMIYNMLSEVKSVCTYTVLSPDFIIVNLSRDPAVVRV